MRLSASFWFSELLVVVVQDSAVSFPYVVHDFPTVLNCSSSSPSSVLFLFVDRDLVAVSSLFRSVGLSVGTSIGSSFQ